MRLLKSAFQKGDSVRGGDLPIGSPPPFRVGESEGQKKKDRKLKQREEVGRVLVRYLKIAADRSKKCSWMRLQGRFRGTSDVPHNVGSERAIGQ